MIRDYREKKNQCDLLWIIHERQRYRGDISNNPQKNLLFYSSMGHAIFHQKNFLLHVQINRFWKLKDNSCIFCLYSKIISSLYQNVSHHEIISIQQSCTWRMQPDIDALHNHITTQHYWYSDRLSNKYGHATQIPNFSIIARKTKKMLHCIMCNCGIQYICTGNYSTG